MTPREALCAAFERRPVTAPVPVWELEFHIWDKVAGRPLYLGREFEALDATAQQRALHTNAELLVEVAEELDFASLTVPGGYWEQAPGEPAYYWLPPEARWQQIPLIRQAVGDGRMLISGSGGVISPPSRTLVEFCYKLFDAPEEIDQQARRTLAGGLATAQRLRDVGVDAVFSASDIADNHGPFFSPPQMDRFVLPYLHDWAEGVKQLGLYAILHTDGQLTPILDDLANSGVHALQAIDPVAGMDLGETYRQVGDRLCLCGNVDCGVLLDGPTEAIEDLTRQTLSACEGGAGFVLGASNAVARETPVEHYRALHRAWLAQGTRG